MIAHLHFAPLAKAFGVTAGSACLLSANVATVQIPAEQAEALQRFKLDTDYACQTTANGLQGCWDVPVCARLGDTSRRTIIEFTAGGFFLSHNVQYNSAGCNDGDVMFVQTQTPPDEWEMMYKVMDRKLSSGGRTMIYQDIFFTSRARAMTGETLGFKIEAGQLCFLPSQITPNGFTTLSDGLLGKWQYEEEYFFSGQHLQDMTACLSRSAPASG